MSDLRLSETNSADDSAGKTWGLEGNLFWHLVGGIFAAVIALLLLYSVARWTIAPATVTAAIPLALSLTYIFTLRQGKPPGYDRELFQLWMRGPGFEPAITLPHPLEKSHHV